MTENALLLLSLRTFAAPRLPICQFLFQKDDFWDCIWIEKADLDKRTNPKNFYSVPNKSVFVIIGPRVAEWILKVGTLVKIAILLNTQYNTIIHTLESVVGAPVCYLLSQMWAKWFQYNSKIPNLFAFGATLDGWQGILNPWSSKI